MFDVKTVNSSHSVVISGSFSNVLSSIYTLYSTFRYPYVCTWVLYMSSWTCVLEWHKRRNLNELAGRGGISFSSRQSWAVYDSDDASDFLSRMQHSVRLCAKMTSWAEFTGVATAIEMNGRAIPSLCLSLITSLF